MGGQRDALGPSWLARHSEPNIEALVVHLGDEAGVLYREFLVEEVRACRPGGLLPAWRAFDRVMCEIARRNREGRS